jgi:hypothetical protein
MENQPAKPVDLSKMSVDEMEASVEYSSSTEGLMVSELATRLRAAEAWRTEVDAWLTNWLMVAGDDPKESVHRLVQAEVQVALDPTVSELAAELRDTYKARAEAAEKVLEDIYAIADDECDTEGDGYDRIADKVSPLIHRTPTPTPATGQETPR